ncbi:sn-1,2-diacylglycerol ethanolamine phosphotransferase [Encephalitozoon intestinalis ATCC 50506]|uniref:Sn-1,2-diacylglycerol ethanolamine phosphotransferase n=1 Tax=Encephalitozoon intestinalis (strain ATCC 50506) TaxID=876142 RepID=E0SAC3_ENCIT|nr:sn-1,2-diacylglycerol ethanolamine phosphotransferase [Encephalitozoon intestinalis ATCC 50506]ADM12548.1 sn-1,2-diacylglycerol ethanolamine phosphotransferase [Encephalitozoon intestinalis ATCC 50506]UTX46404.1 CDP-diacylglycerol--serine O-phosphatidyltransferase [Encephalitozoon intestinalis]
MLKGSFFKIELGADELSSLRKHRFIGTDNSILSKYVIHHYVKWSLEKIPATVAPNTLTLCGFIAMAISLGLTLIFDPYLCNPPRLLSLVNFFLMFVYFTCDNLDGAQARKTGSGSPLGQLFDHGVDSCCALATSIALSSAFGFGLSQKFLIFTLAIMIEFYLAGIEEKFTGHFVLGKISGASEGIAFALISHLITSLCGKGFFQYVFSDEFLWPIKKTYSLILRTNNFSAISAIITTCLVGNTILTLISIESKMRPPRRLSLYSTFLRMMSLIASFVVLHNTLSTESLWIQYLNILMFGQIFSIKYVNEVFSYIIGKDLFLFIPVYLMYLMISVVLQLQNPKKFREAFIAVSFVFSSVYYILVASKVIITFKEALGISFLTITKRNKPEAGR